MRSGSSALRAVKRLQGLVTGSPIFNEVIPNLDFEEFFSCRSVGYSGDEIKLAKRMKWESIAPSLPDQVGLLPSRDFCSGGVLHYVDHFADLELEQVIGKTPKVFVDDGDWPRRL